MYMEYTLSIIGVRLLCTYNKYSEAGQIASPRMLVVVISWWCNTWLFWSAIVFYIFVVGIFTTTNDFFSTSNLDLSPIRNVLILPICYLLQYGSLAFLSNIILANLFLVFQIKPWWGIVHSYKKTLRYKLAKQPFRYKLPNYAYCLEFNFFAKCSMNVHMNECIIHQHKS